MRFAALAGLALFIAVTACDEEGFTPSDSATTVAPLVNEEASRLEQRLNQLSKEIAEAEARVARAKEEARFQECKARVERVNAEARASQAACMNDLAKNAACRAGVERVKGDVTLLGGIVGIAIAIGSAGSATPWALSGLVAGRGVGELSANECPAPECVESFESIYDELMRREGWEVVPQCGGWLGVEVETPLLGLVGGCEVENPGAMGAAGLQQGDFVAFIDDQRVKSADECRAALHSAFAAFETGGAQQTHLKFVRDDQMFRAKLSVQQNYDATVRTANTASHRYGVRVAGLDAQGPLSELIRVGDTVFAVDGQEVVDVEHMRSMLRYRRGGETVSLTLQRAGEDPRSVQTALLDRVDRDGI